MHAHLDLLGALHVSVLVHAFVSTYSAPVECFDDIFFGSGYESVRIRILYSYNEVTSVLLCEQVVVKRCTDSTHVERSGR